MKIKPVWGHHLLATFQQNAILAHEPILANARGLAKLAVHPNFLS